MYIPFWRCVEKVRNVDPENIGSRVRSIASEKKNHNFYLMFSHLKNIFRLHLENSHIQSQNIPTRRATRPDEKKIPMKDASKPLQHTE